MQKKNESINGKKINPNKFLFNFERIFGMIPGELFAELKLQNKFSEGWDSWLAEAIAEKLEREGEQTTGRGDSGE